MIPSSASAWGTRCGPAFPPFDDISRYFGTVEPDMSNGRKRPIVQSQLNSLAIFQGRP